METFIRHLVKIIKDGNVGSNYVDTLVVLPNHRSHRKLLAELSALHEGEAFFAPTVYPMDEFVSFLSPLNTIDSTLQILRLCKLMHNRPNVYFSTENMLSWARQFLHDISDMDMQLQDVEYILQNYAVTSRFETGFGKDELSDNEKALLDFREMLPTVYRDFKKMLSTNSEAYTGMLYRDCAEHVAEYSQKIDYKRVVFAGFYALSPSELGIIKYLKDNFNTEIYFDVDPFYCHLDDTSESEIHRQTSFFIKRDCEQLGIELKNIKYVFNDYETIDKNVEIVATTKKMRQIYCAIDKIKKIKDSKQENENPVKEAALDMSDTVVVLADESLLLPFMTAYDVEGVDLNVTMGLPFSSMTVYALITNLIGIYENAMLLTAKDSKNLRFSGKTVSDFLNNDLFRRNVEEIIDIDRLPNVLEHDNLPFQHLFPVKNRDEVGRLLPDIVLNFCDYMMKISSDTNDLILCQNTVKLMELAKEGISDCFRDDEEVDFAFSKMIVQNFLKQLKLTYTGDTDRGLNVMGVLETRMLDFKNVIVVSVNEGVLPAGLKYDSLLPFDFKYKLDGKDAISNYLYKDQVFAYHFFRLLQRAEDITLIYNTLSENSLSEKSRFIGQLEYETRHRGLDNVINIHHFSHDFSLNQENDQMKNVKKNDKMIAIMEKMSFSASSLKDYITCKLKFFFHYIANIKKKNIIDDNLQAYEFGNVLHNLLKTVFDEMKGGCDKLKCMEIIDNHIENIDGEVEQEIMKLEDRSNIVAEDFKTGYWFINKYILKETIEKYLTRAKEELERNDIRIIDNEIKLESTVGISVPDENGGTKSVEVMVNGTIDRLQRRNGVVEVIDYKTGSVTPSYLALGKKNPTEDEMLELIDNNLFHDKKYEKFFQLMFYNMLYNKTLDDNNLSMRRGAIISTQAVNKNYDDYIFYASFSGDDDVNKFSGVFENCLKSLLSEIFDKSKSFERTEDRESCLYCDYAEFCNR